MDRMLKVGCVGTSSIMEIIVDSLKKTDGMEPVMIYSRDIARGRQFAEKMGVSEATDDYGGMISGDDIDVVYIASPNYIHAEQAVAALNAGKHVIIEKPACVTGDEYDRMYAAAKANGVFFFEATTTLWMPNYLKMLEILPELGKVREVSMAHGQYSSKYDAYLRGEAPNIFNPEMKTGALNDMGIYCIHVAVDLWGEPDAIDYSAVYGDNGIDLEGVLTLKYSDLDVKIHASKNRAPDVPNGCRITGNNGWFLQDGMIHEFAGCTAEINGVRMDVDKQPKVNRMLYEHAAFRDYILKQDVAMFEKYAAQSGICARILETAHKNDAVGR